MADFIHCQRSLYLDQIEKNSFASSSADHDQFHIHLKFSVKSRLSDWIKRGRDSTQLQLLGRINQPLIETFVLVNLNRSLDDEKARETLDKELKNWPVLASESRELIDTVLNKARETVKSTPPCHNSVYLHFRVNVFHIHVFDENRVIERSIEEDVKGCMVPAVESSIESLEKKVLIDSAGTCSICLEDIFRGCQGFFMPCFHVFHGDCIDKWLRTSHYCPICRFEMPTS